MLVTQGNVALIFKGFSVLFDQAYAASPQPTLSPLIMDAPSTGLSEQHNWLLASAGIRELVDEAVINQMLATSYTIYNKEWEETLSLKETEIRADKYGILTPRIQILAADAAFYPDIQMGNLIKTALAGNGTDYTGSAFFGSNKKAYPGAVAFTNLTTAPLTSDAFSAGLANLLARTNAAGRPMNLGTDLRLIVPAALREPALQIVNADNIMQIAGANTAAAAVTNVNKGAAKLTVWPMLDALGLSTAWILADFGSPFKPFIKQTLIPWSYYTLDNPNSEWVIRNHSFLYQIFSSGNMGYGFPEVVYGSTGSGD